MKRCIISSVLSLFVLSLLISGCAGGGKVRISGPEGGLTPEDAKVLKWHNIQELAQRNMLIGFEDVKSTLTKAERDVNSKQAVLRDNIFRRNQIISNLMVDNQKDEIILVNLGENLNSIRTGKQDMDEKIEPTRSRINSISKDRRSLKEKSSVTGQHILEPGTKFTKIPNSNIVYEVNIKPYKKVLKEIDKIKVKKFIEVDKTKVD